MKRNVLVLFCAVMALSLVACQAERSLSSTDVFSGSESDTLSPEKVVQTSTGSTTPFIDPLLGPVADVVLSDGVPPLPKALQKKAKEAAKQVPVKDTVVPLAPPTALPNANNNRGRVVIDPNSPKVGEVVEVRDVTTGTTSGAMPRVIVNPNGPQVGDVVEVRDLGVVGPLPMPMPNPDEGGDMMPPAGGDMAGDLANKTRVEADKRAFMVSNFIQKGRQALADGDLSAARDYFGRALQLDPGNAEALGELNRISDSRPATVTDFVDERVEATRVRRQKAAAEVRNHVERARNLENQERYADARKEYQKALAILTWYDETEDFGITAPRLRDLIQNNKFRAQDAARLRKSEALRDAAQEQANVLEGERMRRLGRVRGYFSAANSAFRQRNYSLAREYANQVLREDPGNADAEMLIQISHDAEHMNNTKQSRLDFDNEWKKVMKEVEYKSLPQVKTVEFPDDWLDEIAHRTPRLVGDPDEDGEEEGIAGMISVLRTKRVKGLNWQEATLDDAVAYLRTITGLNFVVSQRARDEQGESVSISLQLDDVTVDTILDLITSQNGLKWIPQDGVIKIALPDEVSGTMKLRFFDVKDLDTRIQDFVGQEINLTPSNFTPPDAPELEDPQPLFPAENLPDLIQQTIGGEGDWDEPAAIDIKAGVLIVRNTKKILSDIGKLLDDLRANTGILVNLEVRFLTAEDNFLRDVGVDVRGLGDNSQGIGAPGLGSNVTQDDVFFGIPAQGTNPEPSSVGRTNDAGIFYTDGQDGAYAARVENLFDTLLGNPGVLTGSGGLSLQHTFLDDTQMEVILRAVEKSERVQQISAPRLTVYNTQRANVQVLNQVAYVADYEVEIAQASNIANPVVQTILDGIVLDVRPVVSANRRFVSLELRPTVAILTRPIATFSTSLASGPIGANAPVIIQLPQLRVSRVRTTVNMPDQGTLLLGGLIFYEQERLESGIPLLSKLPVLSFLFSRKGNFVNRRNLMVLIRAEIVDLAEREPQDNRDVPELPADEDYLPVIESAPCEVPAAAAEVIAPPSPCDPCAGR